MSEITEKVHALVEMNFEMTDIFCHLQHRAFCSLIQPHCLSLVALIHPIVKTGLIFTALVEALGHQVG